MKTRRLKKLKRSGEFIVLSTIKNQYGDIIPYEEVFFRDGKWQVSYLNCHGSAQLGLGCCQCYSHPTYLTDVVSEQEALDLLKKHKMCY